MRSFLPDAEVESSERHLYWLFHYLCQMLLGAVLVPFLSLGTVLDTAD
jgi:hypothetical protein